MFLTSLTNREKELFLNLAIAVIRADGLVQESEKQILNAYAIEMQIPNHNINITQEVNNIGACIQELAEKSNAQTKRAVFVELLALAFADGDFAAEEKELVQLLAQAFHLDNTMIERVANLQDAYMTAYILLTNFVEKGE